MDKGLLDVLAATAHALYRAMLVGNPSPGVEAIYKRATSPRPGDFVFELGTLGGMGRNGRGGIRPIRGHATASAGASGIGVLERIEREPMPVGPEWDEKVDGPIPTEKVWYVKRLDANEVVRWVNADFIALPPYSDGDPMDWVAARPAEPGKGSDKE